MICRYCGLDTGSGVGHRSQTECITALHDEIARARQLIDRTRDDRIRSMPPSPPAAAVGSSDSGPVPVDSSESAPVAVVGSRS
jgi:hypothetical protein